MQYTGIPVINNGVNMKKKFEKSLLNIRKCLWLWGNAGAGNTKGFPAHRQKIMLFSDDFSNDQETLLSFSANLSLKSEARR